MGFYPRHGRLRYPPSTQFYGDYKCHEAETRIEDEGALMFVCPAEEGVETDVEWQCSVMKKFLDKIPKNCRSKKWSTCNQKGRFNIYAGKATFESAGTCFDYNRHLRIGKSDVGEFLFSITEGTARRYIPKCRNFLRGRVRRRLLKTL